MHSFEFANKRLQPEPTESKNNAFYLAAFTCWNLTQTQTWRKCSGFFKLFTTQEKGISSFGSIPWIRTSLISASVDVQQDSSGWHEICLPSSALLLLLTSSDKTLSSSSSSASHDSLLIKDLAEKNSGRRVFNASYRVKHLPAEKENKQRKVQKTLKQGTICSNKLLHC